mmetsp:Transcript_139/g.167  ORF Transcript_139/g.167 Transcript_139/m.167 type:complete len:82 (+) Transcript_139:214-459(+)
MKYWTTTEKKLCFLPSSRIVFLQIASEFELDCGSIIKYLLTFLLLSINDECMLGCGAYKHDKDIHPRSVLSLYGASLHPID